MGRPAGDEKFELAGSTHYFRPAAHTPLLFEEAFERQTAVGARGGQEGEPINGGTASVISEESPRRARHVAVRDLQFRMIERSLAGDDAWVGERFHEGHDVVDFVGGETERGHGDDVGEIPLEEITAAVVEFHDFAQSTHAAVVHVGSGQGDVAQARGLEGSVAHGGELADALEGVCRLHKVRLEEHFMCDVQFWFHPDEPAEQIVERV